jgi:AcrR family transcriptional regulator
VPSRRTKPARTTGAPRKRREAPAPREDLKVALERLTAREPPREPRKPTRREEVLETALELIASHGVAGASLRRLAKKLGISQPSLYHYFTSKDELLSQIIEHSASRMLGAGLTVRPPTSREDLPRFTKEAVLELYESDSHPRFVRFLFLVAIESKKHRPRIEQMFEQQLNPSFGLLAQAFARDEADRHELTQMMRMLVYSVGFMLLDERALRGHPTASDETKRYADWVEVTARRLLD